METQQKDLIRIVPEWNVNGATLSEWLYNAYKNSTRMECKYSWVPFISKDKVIRIVPEWNVNEMHLN